MNKSTRMMLLYGKEQAPEEHRTDHHGEKKAHDPKHYGAMDEHTARSWMEHLQNEDGTTGAHWTMEQTSQVAAQRGLTYDPVEWWAAMNMVYSDYCGVAKKANANNLDFYVWMACAFLGDKDAGEGKLAKYYQCIVK